MLAFLDLSVAFHTIDHSILLTRLSQSFGVNSSALEWFRSYLTDRKQFVVYDKQPSTICAVKFGVPQGSVLGPLLFILYTADLASIIHKHGVKSHFFADDSQV